MDDIMNDWWNRARGSGRQTRVFGLVVGRKSGHVGLDTEYRTVAVIDRGYAHPLAESGPEKPRAAIWLARHGESY